MKKQITSLLIISILSIAPTAIAENITTSEVKAPVWEEYVPQKYQNPRQFRIEVKTSQNYLLV